MGMWAQNVLLLKCMEVLQIINNFVRNGAQSVSLPLVGDVPDCCLSVIFPAIYEI